ncbi:hypothetical protein D3C81_1470920 [compost metagenome]
MILDILQQLLHGRIHMGPHPLEYALVCFIQEAVHDWNGLPNIPGFMNSPEIIILPLIQRSCVVLKPLEGKNDIEHRVAQERFEFLNSHTACSFQRLNIGPYLLKGLMEFLHI